MRSVNMMNVLLSPHISEKSTRTADKHRQVVFRIDPAATKADVKKAVEKLFDVRVDGVQVCNTKGKKKRFGAVEGRRKATKKAYVTLAEGCDIDFTGTK